MNKRRAPLRKGDVFCVGLDEHTKQYFQYIAIDDTMLGSHVIKIFTRKYAITEEPIITEIIKSPVAFYVHVILQFGIGGKYWTKVGQTAVIDDFSVWFRDTYDYGDGGKTNVSKNWRIWQINQENNDVGVLPPQYYEAEIGLVMDPESIVEKMRNGHYNLTHYPDYV